MVVDFVEQVDELIGDIPGVRYRQGDARFRTFVLVLGYCGLRFGEAAALRVGDVNLASRRIRVSRSVTNVTGKVSSRV